ncbi:hypothetical protein CCM_04316 [Cordyceps militaris CM01]|uniref:Uncharacterized protein n=1 Tax=Cordyceps militaris (strain CM01) TaxID=983644 RepID=G3JEB9_CORMM|nr:uncharacterized protein CCM_04316 [Cordyceps militaris CM01]EGX92944.1 hypothetical protein CCM_04316 [Cordyceps militaris CM01]
MAVDSVVAPGLREAESHTLEQYERIVRFRDEILAGRHATIKIPDSLREAALSLSTHECSPGYQPGQNNTVFASSAQRAVGPSSTATPIVAPPIEPRPPFLSKPDELLRAELQIQRKRAEQELQEDVRRVATGKQFGPGLQDDIDASAVLASALLAVPELSFSAQAQEGAGSGNGPEHDSFDDNTFYSSQHDTPEFQPASPVPLSSAAPAASIVPAKPPPANAAAAEKTPDERRSVNKPRQLRTYEELTEPHVPKQQASILPGLNNYIDKSVASLSQSKLTPSSVTASVGGRTAPTQSTSYIDLHPPSPLLQNNERTLPIHSVKSYPVQPPQPSEIPGLHGMMQKPAPNTGAPAQVAALRSEPGSRTSPESSSQGGQPKRKNRRKKRKSEKQALESQSSFEISTQQIKAEPRSPSPLPGPSYIRPNKRQRQAKAQNQNATHDEMSYDPAMPNGPSNSNDVLQRVQTRQEPAPTGYEGSGAYFAAAPAMPDSTRVGRDYATDRVITDDGYRREHIPQLALPYDYSSRGPHMSRPVHADPYQDGALPYGNSSRPARYSVHTEGDGFHESTRSHPARILVDAYGREYIEPTRQLVHHSIAPSPLPGEPDRLYERAPAQPLARYQGPGTLEERGYMFTQPASPYVGPRRILTQPEYVTFENRDGRYREYSTRPLAASGEFVPVRPQEHRIYAEGGREYIGRASSMHPVEQTRIASGLSSYGHAANVRPEASGVVYGIERNAAPGAVKSYGSWPSNQGMVEREGGIGLYTGTAPNAAGSSRSTAGPDATTYGRGNTQDGFR